LIDFVEISKPRKKLRLMNGHTHALLGHPARFMSEPFLGET
jgi:hypothetical protein